MLGKRWNSRNSIFEINCRLKIEGNPIDVMPRANDE